MPARALAGFSPSPHLFPARRQVGSHATAQLARPALRACNSRCTAAAILAPSVATGDALKHGTAVRTHICKHAVITALHHRQHPTTQGPDPTNQQEPNSHDQTEVWRSNRADGRGPLTRARRRQHSLRTKQEPTTPPRSLGRSRTNAGGNGSATRKADWERCGDGHGHIERRSVWSAQQQYETRAGVFATGIKHGGGGGGGGKGRRCSSSVRLQW